MNNFTTPHIREAIKDQIKANSKNKLPLAQGIWFVENGLYGEVHLPLSHIAKDATKSSIKDYLNFDEFRFYVKPNIEIVDGLELPESINSDSDIDDNGCVYVVSEDGVKQLPFGVFKLSGYERGYYAMKDAKTASVVTGAELGIDYDVLYDILD